MGPEKTGSIQPTAHQLQHIIWYCDKPEVSDTLPTPPIFTALKLINQRTATQKLLLCNKMLLFLLRVNPPSTHFKNYTNCITFSFVWVLHCFHCWRLSATTITMDLMQLSYFCKTWSYGIRKTRRVRFNMLATVSYHGKTFSTICCSISIQRKNREPCPSFVCTFDECLEKNAIILLKTS